MQPAVSDSSVDSLGNRPALFAEQIAHDRVQRAPRQMFQEQADMVDGMLLVEHHASATRHTPPDST